MLFSIVITCEISRVLGPPPSRSGVALHGKDGLPKRTVGAKSDLFQDFSPEPIDARADTNSYTVSGW